MRQLGTQLGNLWNLARELCSGTEFGHPARELISPTQLWNAAGKFADQVDLLWIPVDIKKLTT